MSTGRQRCQCGRDIPLEKIAQACIEGKLLYCTKCHTFTTAVTIDSVAGNLKAIVKGKTEVLVEARQVQNVRGN